MRKPTLTGWFVAGSVDGRAILWDLCEEKRSSRPPLGMVLDVNIYCGCLYVRDIREFDLDGDR